MSDDQLKNHINLDTSVSEQIADMQLIYLRQSALNRPLSLEEIKILEVLSKVKNAELEKRETPKEDPKKAKARKLEELAATPLTLLPKETENEDKKTAPVSES